MRVLVSVALYILGICSLLLGVAERTIWAPETTSTLSLKIDASQPLVVIPNSILTLKPGTPTVEVSGNANVFVATGREADVNAWVGGSSVDTLTFDKKTKKVTAIESLSDVPSANPSGSDLWRTERSAEKRVLAKVDTANQAAVIIASDGIEAAPDAIKIVWARTVDTIVSDSFLISGFLLLIATLVYNLIVLRNIRNSRKPRRRLPKAPQGPKMRRRRRENSLPKRGRRAAGRSFMVIPAAMVSMALFAGCTPSSTANQAATPEQTKSSTKNDALKPVSLELGQIRKIMTKVAAVAKNADQTLSATDLFSRFTGPALEIRSTAYSLIKKSKKAPALESIFASPLTLSLPAATDTWPRTLMVASGNQKDRLPILLTLQQSSPREQYKVVYLTTLISGLEMPQIPAVTEGGIPIQIDSAYLEMSPLELIPNYGSVIDIRASAPNYAKFDLSKDSFFTQISKIQTEQSASLTSAKLTFDHLMGDAAPIGLTTSDGGALVAVFMKDSTTIKPKKRNAGITVNALEQVALGAKGSLKGVVSTYGDMLLFYVPSIGSTGKIQLLGWQSYLLKVKSL